VIVDDATLRDTLKNSAALALAKAIPMEFQQARRECVLFTHQEIEDYGWPAKFPLMRSELNRGARLVLIDALDVSRKMSMEEVGELIRGEGKLRLRYGCDYAIRSLADRLRVSVGLRDQVRVVIYSSSPLTGEKRDLQLLLDLYAIGEQLPLAVQWTVFESNDLFNLETLAHVARCAELNTLGVERPPSLELFDSRMRVSGAREVLAKANSRNEPNLAGQQRDRATMLSVLILGFKESLNLPRELIDARRWARDYLRKHMSANNWLEALHLIRRYSQVDPHAGEDWSPRGARARKGGKKRT